MLQNLSATVHLAMRNPLNSLISVFGVALGLSSFVVIIAYLFQENSYNSWIPDAEQIFRVETAEVYPGRTPLRIARTPGPLADAMREQFPEIEDITRGYVASMTLISDARYIDKEVLVTDTNFLRIIELEVLRGDRDALEDSSSVLISERFAREYFGANDSVGQTLTLRGQGTKDYLVAGIFSDIPMNSHLDFDLVIGHDSYFSSFDQTSAGYIPDQWGGAYFHTYLKVKRGALAEPIENGLDDLIDARLPDDLAQLIGVAPHEFFQFRLIPISDIHLHGHPLAAMKPGGDPKALLMFTGIAVLILAIATINFSTGAVAAVLARRREFAIRKILGATSTNLARLNLAEAALYVTLATGLAVICIFVILLMDDLFLGDVIWMNPWGQWSIYCALFLGAACVCLTAAAYPVYRASRIRPYEAQLSGRTGGQGAFLGHQLLVGLQFFVIIGLLSYTFVVVAQLRHANTIELGYEAANLIVFEEPNHPAAENSAIEERLALVDGVINASRSSAAPFLKSSGSEANTAVSVPGSAKPVTIGFYQTDVNFFDTFGVQPVAGRVFSPARQGDILNSDDTGGAGVVVNMSAIKRLGFDNAADAVNSTLTAGDSSYKIVGVVDDIRFRSAREGRRDEMFIPTASPGSWIIVRYDPARIGEILAEMNSVWSVQYPGYESNFIFLTDVVAIAYQNIRFQLALLGLFTMLGLILTSVGLFATSSFVAHYRTGEMAVRRVIGAQMSDIILLFGRQLLTPVLGAVLLSTPTAFWLSSIWLNNFADRISVSPLPFLLGSFIALAIAVPTILYHAVTVSSVSPAEVLNVD